MMRTFFILITIFLALAANAQTGRSYSAKDYIKQREQTDANTIGAKRSRLKISEPVRPVVIRDSIPVQRDKKKHKE